MTLRVYSSLAVYQIQPEQDPHRALYERCKRTPGVEYCGSLSQTALAQALAEADVFAYPSTFEETSCIALMEAMASGCLPICSDLGALRETAAGFAWMIGPAADSGPGALAQRFADSAGEAIATAVDQPLQWRERLERQRAFALERYTWSARSAEWEGFLEDLLRQTASGPAPGAHRA
jgi:glycosyltransferase involved in cell wall biosynthesis